MAWTLTARGSSKATYVGSANVGNTFTPAENDIIIVFNTSTSATPHDGVTGWGASFGQILAPTTQGGLNVTAWAARIGASPGSGQANIDFGGASVNYTAAVIQISGANTTAAIGVGGSSLFRQVAALGAYDPASPFSITALSAFSSSTNLSLTLGALSTNLGIAPKSGFTEIIESSGATYQPNVWAAYKTSSDTAHQLVEEVNGDFNYQNVLGVAIEMLEAASGGTSITPTAGSLALTGNAATVSNTSSVTRSPTAGSLGLTGSAPILTLTVAAPVVGSLDITGQAPTLVVGTIRIPTTGSLALTGSQPSVANSGGSRSISPTAGSLSATGAAPTTVIGTVMTPTATVLAFTGPQPSVANSGGSRSISPTAGSLSFGTQTATIANSGAATTSRRHAPVRMGGMMIFG